MRSHTYPLVGVAALALAASASGASAVVAPTHEAMPQTLLYSQNNHSTGEGLVSQIFHSGQKRTSIGADDFTVPVGMTWTISEVDVTGHDARAGFARGVIVRFYGTAHHQPHGIIADVHVGWPGTPVMQLKLGQGAVTLSEGRYWMSTQVDGDGADPFWVWHMRSKQHGDGAVWRNPEDGFRTGCAEWSLLDQCATRGVGPDFMFALRGTSTRS